MLGIVLVTVISATALWVYLDATRNKIGKIPGTGGAFNMSAGAWGAVTLLLWIVGFPAYLIKRGSLIAQAKDKPIEVTGRGGKATVLGILGGVWVALTVATYISGSLPSCDAPEVVSLGEKVIRDAPLVKLSGLQVKGISLPAERSYDPSVEKRVCRAMLTHALGEEAIQYSVEWHDKSKGMIWVQILSE